AALADQPTHVLIGHLDLDRDRAPAAVHGVDLDLLGLVCNRLRDELHQRAVVHRRTGGGAVPPEATSVVEATATTVAAPPVAEATPERGSIRTFSTLHIAPELPLA